ncbi:RNA ligase family protein [Streptomyces sp. NPDC002088]|uniref:RNA ligase family protein n=1 Tax=Streptomyces sp. NPDC002088 TaxID=3154665 RepID=UPI003322D6F5
MTILKASDYPKFKSIPRLHRKSVLTEKIDGSNGLVEIVKAEEFYDRDTASDRSGVLVRHDGEDYVVSAGSRNRWLTPDTDNFGFAQWVFDHAQDLVRLGVGRHYGEWFGKGIQSGYGLDERRFALFNVKRWYDPRDPEITPGFLEQFPKAEPAPESVTVVPVISVIDGRWLNEAVEEALHTLESEGSFIAPGFQNPEGVVVWHDAAQTYFKATLKNDEQPKSKAAAK